MAELLECPDGRFGGRPERAGQLVGDERVAEAREALLDVEHLRAAVARSEDPHVPSVRRPRGRRKRGERYRCGARSRRIASFGFAPITRATSCPPLNRISDGIDITPYVRVA